MFSVQPSHILNLGSQYLGTLANPLMYRSIWEAAKMVKSPDPSFSSVYDQWLDVTSKNYNGTRKPT